MNFEAALISDYTNSKYKIRPLQKAIVCSNSRPEENLTP